MGRRGPRANPVIHDAPMLGLFGAKKSPASWEESGINRATRVIRFIESLPITSGMHAGRKFKLRPWQKKIIRDLYKTKGKKCVVREALITMPRKNGKTALAAGLALCHLVGPEAESRGQVYSAASDRDQAGIIFNELVAIIEAVPEFTNRIIVQRFKKALEDSVTGSTYHALSADSRKAHGLSPSFVVYDELAQARDRHLYDNLITGTGARAEPLFVVISTMSSDPNHVLSELVEYGRKINENIIEDKTFHASIFQAHEDADPWDEKTWYACNPALGDFRSLDEMRKAAEQAKRIPAREASFRNLYLNQAVDPQQRFISSADWDACNGPVDPKSLHGRPCWGGLDLGSTKDLTSLTLYFPEDEGEVVCWFWIPAESIGSREDRDRVPYRVWSQNGLIEAVPGRAIDRRAIALHLADIASQFDIRGIAYDRWRMEDLQVILDEEGIKIRLVPWGQGFKDMGPAVDILEAAILDAKIKHGANPVLTWNVSNAIVQVDPAGARKINKEKSIERVDGLVSLTMAMGLHAREAKPKQYDFSASMVITT